MTKGQLIGGSFSELIARQKADEAFEIGELLVAEKEATKVLLQVTDVQFGSQVSQQQLELISGMHLEESTSFTFMDPKLRLYNLATLKSVLTITKEKTKAAKILPTFFSEVREVTKEDMSFLTKPKNSLFVGNLRSGSKELDVPIFLNGKEVLSHHVLIPATTGKGKSNLTSVMLWDVTGKDYAGMLVLDPHDEYFERLQNHPQKERIAYYTPAPPPGQRTLKIHLSQLRPEHFNGVAEWTTPQKEAMSLAYKLFNEEWITRLLVVTELSNVHEATVAVVKRRLADLLGLSVVNKEVHCQGIFDQQAGETTIRDIVKDLEEASTVIINTSSFSGRTEILIGSLIAAEALNRYKYHKNAGTLTSKPVISIILEEAPRVLGKDVLEKGTNIFATIAREGRKFKVGLVAITQLPSLIPRQILANINTKIILGVEMAPERQAIIESASQDLSDDNRNIASLDKGEAIITSNFVPFAVPITIPLFQKHTENDVVKKAFNDLTL